MEKVCDTCRFYYMCKCYRYPPSHYMPSGGGTVSAYPDVWDIQNNWCGEWQPKRYDRSEAEKLFMRDHYGNLFPVPQPGERIKREHTDEDFAFIKENLDGLLDEYREWKPTGMTISEFVDMKLEENHERNKKKRRITATWIDTSGTRFYEFEKEEKGDKEI